MKVGIRALWVLLIVLCTVPALVEASKEFRLDGNVAPTFQSVELNLDANRVDYNGSVEVDLEVKSATDRFSFHAQNMTFDRVEMKGKGGNVPITWDLVDGLVDATLERPLSPGKYTLSIDFHKDYNTRAVGLYRMEKDGQGYLFSQFEDQSGQ